MSRKRRTSRKRQASRERQASKKGGCAIDDLSKMGAVVQRLEHWTVSCKDQG